MKMKPMNSMMDINIVEIYRNIEKLIYTIHIYYNV